jgi:hypothetical protein
MRYDFTRHQRGIRSHSSQALRAQPVSHPMRIGVSFTRDKAAGAWTSSPTSNYYCAQSVTIYLHLPIRLQGAMFHYAPGPILLLACLQYAFSTAQVNRTECNAVSMRQDSSVKTVVNGHVLNDQAWFSQRWELFYSQPRSNVLYALLDICHFAEQASCKGSISRTGASHLYERARQYPLFEA